MGGSPQEADGTYVATSGNAQARAPACRRGASSASGGAAEESHRRERHVPSNGDASRWCDGRCASCRPASHSLADVAAMVAPAETGGYAASATGGAETRGGVSLGRGSPAARAVRGEKGLPPSRSRAGTGVRLVRFRYSCNPRGGILSASGTKAAPRPRTHSLSVCARGWRGMMGSRFGGCRIEPSRFGIHVKGFLPRGTNPMGVEKTGVRSAEASYDAGVTDPMGPVLRRRVFLL